MSDSLDKLQLSRERLRLAMLPPPTPEPAPPRRRGDSWVQPQAWMHKVRDLPYVNEVVAFVESWWSHHPMRPVMHIAEEAGNAVARPIAQRSPLSLVLGAAAVGAALAWVRPWRLLFRSALFAGLVPQLASRIVSRLPLESWMKMASSMVTKRAPVSGRAAAPHSSTSRPVHQPSTARPSNSHAAASPVASATSALARETSAADMHSAGPIPHV